MARTRDEIASAARKAFERHGYDSTTLEDIAAAAEVHKRTLLRYFPTKTHLALHVAHAAFDNFSRDMAARGQKPTIEVWRDHVLQFAEEMRGRADRMKIERVDEKTPELLQARLGIQSQYQALIAAGLSQDYKRDPAADIVSKVVAAALVGGSFAVGRMILRRDGREDLESAELDVIRLAELMLHAVPKSVAAEKKSKRHR